MARSDPVSRGELNALARLCDQRFADQERAVLAALAAQEKLYQAGMQATATAVLKAETATERRFESVNEFRAQLGDQARSFLPRVEYDRAHADLTNQLHANVKALTEKIEANAVAMAEKIDELARGRDRELGGRAALIGFITLVALIVGIFVAVH